ncbi:ATP-binding protein [Parablautia muri]|uniref:ATP-binding protein n=1 Tax=Parablautia muri TaxID=2320879 RepID=A0A9X5BJY5_9FIRM|nr:ATP-binding protein [Parablautia muri]NBJ95106.1 ATP-binding protein [Parablautia muri]
MKKFCSYLRADLKRLLCSAKIILSVAVTVVVLLLAMLEGPYIGGKMEEAKVYDAELKNLLSEMTGEIKSGNPVTDVILQMQKKEAEKRNIRFRSDFRYPKGSWNNVFDISVILNNALQDAMENVKHFPSENTNGDAFCILVHSYHRNNAYMIEICNSFTGDLQWNTENELPVATKRADGHGYGLINIRRVVEKYSGNIAIDEKNGEFCISIMLMMDSE